MKKSNKVYTIRFFLILVIFISLIQGSLADVLHLPAVLEVIEVEAFCGDDSLDEVVLPEGIVSIGSRAFLNSSLRKINLPDSLTFIANDAFDGPDEVSVTANTETYAYNWAVAHEYILPAPTQNDSEGGTKQITVSWSAVDNADSYSVYYGTSNNIASAIEITGITATSQTITDTKSWTPCRFITQGIVDQCGDFGIVLDFLTTILTINACLLDQLLSSLINIVTSCNCTLKLS